MAGFPLTRADVVDLFRDRDFSRGYDYYRNGRVEGYDLYWKEGDDVAIIRAKVQGNSLYRQHIEILGLTYDDLSIDMECDCPVGYLCKHSAAVLLQVLHDQSTGAVKTPASQWLEKFIDANRLEQTLPLPAPEENAHFLIIRLFDDQLDHFTLHKAKFLKNGTISKGTKLAESDLPYLARYKYYHSFLTPDDRQLIAELGKLNITDDYNPHYRFHGEYGAVLLKKVIQTGRCYFREGKVPLRYVDAPLEVTFGWRSTPKGYRLHAEALSGKALFYTDPPIAVDPETSTACTVSTPYTTEAFALLVDAPPVESDEMIEMTQTVLVDHPEVAFPLPDAMQSASVVLPAQPRLRLFDWNDTLGRRPAMVLSFGYGEYEVDALPPLSESYIVDDQSVVRLQRDEAAEAEARDAITSAGFAIDAAAGAFLGEGDMRTQAGIERWRKLIDEILPRLEEEGWHIEIASNFHYRFDTPDGVEIETREEGEVNDWFSIAFHVEVGGRQIALLPILIPLLEEYDSVEALPPVLNLQYEEGRFLHMAARDVAPILQTIYELFDKREGDALVLKPYDAHLIALDEHTVWKGPEELRQLAQKLKNFQGIDRIEPAETLQAELREYQRFGLDWLFFLHTFRFGGILADDMGLGKTIQTLALLQYLKHTGDLNYPVLIIMPTSLMGNWKNEIRRFTPDLSYLELYGADRAERFEEMDRYDVILTTYGLAQRDRERYEGRVFEYIILDEAQKIKNPATQMAHAIKSFTARHRLALTGTPIENHLGELWSIFDFVMPGFLDTLKVFRELYQYPVEREHDLQRQSLLNRKIAPFVLRRTKEEVVLELPSKTEIVKRAIFAPAQAKLYENIRVTMEKKVRETIKGKGLSRSHITLLDALLKLRQVCCDPRLIPLSSAAKVKDSAKLDLFLELLDELMSEGRKVLVFSQFTSMLTLIEAALKGRRYRWTKLTGATRKREEAIARFTEGDADIFLISLKAGGVGLNLVEADTVIHYDPWWNPAVENQATDRAYRIGQDKPVFVYKLIVENTIEEKILTLQEKKRALQEAVYDRSTDKQTHFDGEELLELLRL